MQPIEINDRKSFEAWLNATPQRSDTAKRLMVRASLRAMPAYWANETVPRRSRGRALHVLRMLMLSSVVVVRPSVEVAAAIRVADERQRSVGSFAGDSAIDAAEILIGSLPEADIATTVDQAAEGVARHNSPRFAWLASDTRPPIEHDNGAEEVFWRAVQFDVSRNRGVRLMEESLWHDLNPLQAHCTSFVQSTKDEHWDFWRRWYQAALEGHPLIAGDWDAHWALLEQIALIDPDDSRGLWTDPTAVAAEIRRIEEQHRLLAEVRALRAELAKASDPTRPASAAHRSSNLPESMDPLDVSDPTLSSRELAAAARAVREAAQALAGLEATLQADRPDAETIHAETSRLEAAMTAILAWCGRKADLAVDTAIKWSVPAGAAWLFTNQERVAALVSGLRAFATTLGGPVP